MRLGALAVVLLSALPPPAPADSSAALGVEISTEFALPHPPWQPDPRAQTYPAIAAGSGGYLAVWIGAAQTSTAPSLLQAMRLDATGAPVDRQVIPIGTTGASASYRPAVAWDGTRFLVVYRTSANSLVGRFVTPEGQVLEPELAFAAATTSSEDLRWPAVACSGTECLVAWWRYQINTGHSVRLALVSGGAVQQSDRAVSSASSDQHEPAISWNGTHYLVVWRDIRRADGGDIYGARVAPTGEVQDAEGFPISMGSGTEQAPAVSWNESRWLVVWQDSRSGTEQILGARVTPAAAVEDPDGLVLSPQGGDHTLPRVAWNGTDHLVVWSKRSGDVYAARVSTAGVVANPPEVLSQNRSAAAQPAVTASGTDFGVAWQCDVNGDTDVYAARVTAEGTVAPPGASYLAAIPSAEEQPAVASDGTDSFVLWRDYRNGSGRLELRAARMSADGLPLEPQDLLVTQEKLPTQGRVAVAHGAGVYLLVYSPEPFAAQHPVMGVRFSRDGTRLDSQPFKIGDGAGNGPVVPSIAWNGTDFFVVWQGLENVQGASPIVGARVTPQGQVRDATPLRLSHTTRSAFTPSVAWNGSIYLVVWEEWMDRFTGVTAISGSRVRADGSLLDSQDMPLLGDNFVEPVLAASPRGFLLAAHTDWNIEMLVFSADGTTPGTRLELARGWHAAPSLVWDGATYVLAWARTSSPYSQDREIRAARVNTVGTVLDSPAQVLAQTFGTSWDWQAEFRIIRPTVVTSGSGRSTVFFPKFAALPQNERMKEVHLFGRRMTGTPNGAACTSAEMCSSNVCASGVCCDRPCAGACGTGICEELEPQPDGGVPPPGDGGCTPSDAGCETPAPAPPAESHCGCDSMASPFALLVLVLAGLRAHRRPGAP